MKNSCEIDLATFEAFLFDLDGTLIDGSDRHFVWCVQETAKEFGKAHCTIPPGAPLGKFLRQEFPEQDEHFIAEFAQRNKQRMQNTPRPVQFHQDAIKFIQAYSSIPRAIVTNCVGWELELTKSVLDVHEFFNHIHCNTPDIAGKPAGDLYVKAAKELNIPPEKCLVFEDSFTGIQAGKNAGMVVIALDRGTHDQFAQADMVISSFEELL